MKAHHNFLIIGVLLLQCTIGLSQANNNPCANAPLLTVGSSCSYTTGTIANNDTYQQNANNFGTPSCGPLGSEPDVWYAFTAPASGAITATTAAGGITDGVMEIYESDCAGSYTSLGCNDDPLSGTMPELTIGSLTPGNTYFIRFWDYSGGSGTFDICLTESNAPTMYSRRKQRYMWRCRSILYGNNIHVL